MAIEIRGVVLPLDIGDENAALREAAAKTLGVREPQIASLRVRRQSVDSRKNKIRLVYTLHVSLHDTGLQKTLEDRFGRAHETEPEQIEYGTQITERAVVVGAGPCGLFAALELAQHGYRPLVLERGKRMAEREEDVARLMREGVLDPESNICFGAGGAGAFSDGKLTTRIKDSRAETVLEVLTAHGAPKEILVLAKPHTGTEHIRAAVGSMIQKIEALGGQVMFGCRLNGLDIEGGQLTGIRFETQGVEQRVKTRSVVLAAGGSARDTYAMLMELGAAMQPKPFAVGLRIEHKREAIDKAQYGEYFAHPRLGAAEYRLATKSSGRGVYTFCMCPGGQVILSASEPGGVAVNGMSGYARSGENSNSAVVVSVTPEDFGAGAMDGVVFQRTMERAAYEMAGGYGAPVQTVGDFLAGKPSTQTGSVSPTILPYAAPGDLRGCLPAFAAAGVKAGIEDFGRKLKGFDDPQAVLTGVETRTSAPLRILRNSELQASNIRGLYPAGEGAGYAGGIVSAAVDGIKCAQALIKTFAQPRG